jgi:hypothetical protein
MSWKTKATILLLSVLIATSNVTAKGAKITSVDDPDIATFFKHYQTGFLFPRKDLDRFNKWDADLNGIDLSDGRRILGCRDHLKLCMEKPPKRDWGWFWFSTTGTFVLGLMVGGLFDMLSD